MGCKADVKPSKARPKLGEEPWQVRFSPITAELSVQFNLVFIGAAAQIASSLVEWPQDFRHEHEGDAKREPTLKLYLKAESGKFDLSDIPEPLISRVAFCEWTFKRSTECRAVCAPRPIPRHYLSLDVLTSVDIDAAEKALWGFGRPNAYKPHAPVNQLLSGTLVDYIPGAEPENRQGWVFAPVFIKVQPNAGKSYIAKLYPVWLGNFQVAMLAETNPADAPEELVQYDFGPRASERPSGADIGNEGLAALARNAVERRR